MSRAPQKAGKKRIRNREMVGQALELRKAGASYAAIGETLGMSKTRAYELVMEGLRDLNDRAAEVGADVKRLELERVDALLLALWPQRKNPRVVDSILRAMDRRARLLGLDAPTLVAPTTPEGKALPSGGLDLSKLTTEQLEQLEAIHRAAAIVPAPAVKG